MSTPRPGYSAISSYSRVEIMNLLQQRPQRTIAELTTATGLHPNTVREHLHRLIDAGYVVPETEHRTTRGRPRVLYSAATGAPEASSPVARRKVRDAAQRGDLLRRILPAAAAAATLPSDAAHQLDALVEDLEDAGFEPLVDERSLTIDLTPCPHASSQSAHRQTLCAVHLGLMQGVLSQAAGPLDAACIRPPRTPEECVVELQLR